jgi:signal transduction histidine kinase
MGADGYEKEERSEISGGQEDGTVQSDDAVVPDGWPAAEEARLRALEESGLLDAPPEAAFDRLTDLVRQVLGVPVALVSLVAEDRQVFKSHQGLGEPWCSLAETPLSHSFCQHVVGRDAPLVVDDARAHALVRETPAIEALGVAAYLGVPLRTPEGAPIGSLCAIDSEARAWTERDQRVLETLAATAATEIAVRYHLRKRTAAEAALRTLNETLERQVEERTERIQELSRALTLAEQRERMRIARVLHDDLQQMLVAAKMAGSFGDMERLGDALDRAIRITRTLAQELSPGLLRSKDLHDLLRWLAERMYEQHELSVEIDAANILVPDDAVRVLLYQLVRELLFNVVKHAGTRRAHVSAGVVGGHVCLVVEDKGAGFDPSALDGQGGTGLGLPSVRERLELVGGRLVVESAPGEGASVVIYAPLKERPV